MVHALKFHLVVISLLSSFLVRAETIDLEAVHLLRKVKGLAGLVQDADNLNSCFRVEGDTLHLFLKNCADLRASDVPTQKWALSDPLPSALSEYIAPVESQFGNDPALSEKFEKMKSYIPHDSAGRLIFMNFKNKPIVVGFIKTDIAQNENPYKKAHIVELCSGPWISICKYNAAQKKFVWSFRHGVYNEEEFDTVYTQYEIVDFLHSSLYSRGNDDFQPLTYFSIKSPGGDQEAPLTQDWADALRSVDQNSRISTDRSRSPIPRSEANYMTALHPINIVVVKEGRTLKRFAHFGAKVYYPRQAMEDSCEDDNGIYGLVDLKKINPTTPINPEEISHMNLNDLKKEGGINSNYDDFLENVEYSENSRSTILFADVNGTAQIPDNTTSWALAIMSLQNHDSVNEMRPNNPVREFLFLDKKEDENWSSSLYAFNPNDWEANNSLQEKRQLLHSPTSIRPVWNLEDPQTLKSTHPVLRAPMKILQQIPFEKASAEDREISKKLRKQFSEERFSGIQLNTTHGTWGLEDKYHSLIMSFSLEATQALAVDPSRIPPFIVIPNYRNNEVVYENVETDPVVLEWFSKVESRNLKVQLFEILKRIYAATDTPAQISAELKHYELISSQVYAMRDFHRQLNELPQSETRINDILKIIWSEIPKNERKETYTDYSYVDDQQIERQVPLPEELKKSIFDESTISVAQRIKKVEDLLKSTHGPALSFEDRKAAAEKMHTFLREESELLNSWGWLLERYNNEHPRG